MATEPLQFTINHHFLETMEVIDTVNREVADNIIDLRLVSSTKSTYENARKKLKMWLSSHHQQSLGGPLTAPIKNREIILPLNVDVVLAFLGDAQRLNNDGTQRNEEQPPIAFSTMTTITSSISDLYRQNNIEMDPVLKNQMRKFMKGYKRKISELKQTGQMSIYEGKRALSEKGFVAIATFALLKQQSRTGSLYPHLFTILCWNLFARSHSVAIIMLQHIAWKDDALIITLPKHKGDQEGQNVFPKHVFANPLRPQICPVLALGIYSFCVLTYHRDTTDWNLFSGSKVEAKFSIWLRLLTL